MHESSLAKQLVDVALAQAHAAGATRIRTVHGWIAESEALSPAVLQTHFAAYAAGTAAADARLCLRLVQVTACCVDCGAIYLPEHHDVLLCPACGSVDGRLSGPTGLALEALDVE